MSGKVTRGGTGVVKLANAMCRLNTLYSWQTTVYYLIDSSCGVGFGIPFIARLFLVHSICILLGET